MFIMPCIVFIAMAVGTIIINVITFVITTIIVTSITINGGIIIVVYRCYFDRYYRHRHRLRH